MNKNAILVAVTLLLCAFSIPSPRAQLQTQTNQDKTATAAHISALIAQVNDAVQNKQWQAAADALKQLIEIDPARWQYYQTLGSMQFNLAQFDDSTQTLEKAILIAEDEASGKIPGKDPLKAQLGISQMLMAEGNALIKLKKNDEALALFMQAAEISPTPAVAYFNICVTLFNSGNMDGASAACDKAIAADPKKADAYFVKALSLFGGGKLNPEGKYIPPLGTIDALDKYLSLAPDGPHANDAKQMVAFAYSKVDISFASVGLPASSDPLSGKPFVEPEVVKENLLVFVPPAYPPLARTMRIQGDVDLQALINEHGNIEYLRVTTGQPLLYKSAIDAAKQWKYKPFLINGKPVAVSATFTVRFQMDPSK